MISAVVFSAIVCVFKGMDMGDMDTAAWAEFVKFMCCEWGWSEECSQIKVWRNWGKAFASFRVLSYLVGHCRIASDEALLIACTRHFLSYAFTMSGACT